MKLSANLNRLIKTAWVTHRKVVDDMKMAKVLSAAMATVATFAVMATSVFAAPSSNVDWNRQVITVTGAGYPPNGVHIPSQSKNLAERAALNDAYRLLAEIVEGVFLSFTGIRPGRAFLPAVCLPPVFLV